MRKKPEVQRQIAAQCVLNVRNGSGVSRKELSTVMNMSPSTAGFYVDQLIARGFLIETGLGHGMVGRPKRCLEARKEAGWFAGLEWSADQLQAVNVDFAGTRQGGIERALQRGMSAKELVRSLDEVVEELKGRSDSPLLGIGLGAPGVVDTARGTAGDYRFIEGWKDVPLRARLERRFGVPVTVESNLRVIAMAERWFGDAAKLEDFIIFGPRSGVGVAIMHRGSILGGVNHAAGELGNWWWHNGNGGGELHDSLSAAAVWRRLAGARRDDPPPEDLAGAMQKLGACDNEKLREVAADFARAIGCLHLLLDTGAFFVHGPLCGLGSDFWELQVVAQAQKLMPRLVTRPPRVRCSGLLGDAGALGAASLAMEAWAPSL